MSRPARTVVLLLMSLALAWGGTAPSVCCCADEAPSVGLAQGGAHEEARGDGGGHEEAAGEAHEDCAPDCTGCCPCCPAASPMWWSGGLALDAVSRPDRRHVAVDRAPAPPDLLGVLHVPRPV